jgi:hypothetical protein
MFDLAVTCAALRLAWRADRFFFQPYRKIAADLAPTQPKQPKILVHLAREWRGSKLDSRHSQQKIKNGKRNCYGCLTAALYLPILLSLTVGWLDQAA